MSVINVIKQTNAIHVVTDGLLGGGKASDPIVAKAVALPHIPCVIAARGAVMAPLLVATQAQGARDFDDLGDRWNDILQIVMSHYPKEMSGDGAAPALEFLVAGWSRRNDEPGLFFMTTGAHIDGAEPWSHFDPVDNYGCFIWPADEAVERRIASDDRFSELRRRADKIDPSKAARLMVELQRERAETIADSFSTIGGNVILSTVTNNTVTQREICRWSEHRKAAA